METDNLEKIQESDTLEKTEAIIKKPKRQQTEAQKANTEKMRLALIAKHEASKKAKHELALEKQAKYEEKIIKKAEALRKKEERELKILNDIKSDSDDDSELEAPLVAKPKKSEKARPAKPVKEAKQPKTKSIKKPKRPPTPELSVTETEEEDEEEEDEEYEPVRKQQYYQQQYRQLQPQKPIVRYV